MDQVTKQPMTKSQLKEFVELVNHLETTHSLTTREVILLLRMITGFATDITIPEQFTLSTKGLLSSNGKDVLEGLLWTGKEAIQTSMVMLHNSKPKANKTALDIVEKIAATLLPDNKEKVNSLIEDYAVKYFQNDLEIARYFTILRFIYPPLKEEHNANWVNHFIVQPNQTNLWSPNAKMTSKFRAIYIKKDIGIFLLGVYYAMKDSIDLNKGAYYMPSIVNFMEKYDVWYEYAEEKVNQAVVKEAKTVAIPRVNKIDTL